VGSREVATRRPRDICIDLPYELAEVIGVRGAHVVVPPRNHDAIAEIRRSLFGRQHNGLVKGARLLQMTDPNVKAENLLSY
jgi:hypothetical protein